MPAILRLPPTPMIARRYHYLAYLYYLGRI